MEEKYYEILRHYVNPNDCAIVVNQLLSLHNVSNSVVCGNCDGYGYTVDENGRRKEHCKKCE
tara:strand:- start:3371 stop:3556 length:186 start_codon:yes stop_codon:yes gene_type:complete